MYILNPPPAVGILYPPLFYTPPGWGGGLYKIQPRRNDLWFSGPMEVGLLGPNAQNHTFELLGDNSQTLKGTSLWSGRTDLVNKSESSQAK